jgi:hypothetical protein
MTLPLLRDMKELIMANFGNIPLDVEGFEVILGEFASRNYSERDIETLAEKCKRIRCVDLDGVELSYPSSVFN